MNSYLDFFLLPNSIQIIVVVNQITPKISAKRAGTNPAIPDIQTLNANAVTILRIKKINPEKIINNVRKILGVLRPVRYNPETKAFFVAPERLLAVSEKLAFMLYLLKSSPQSSQKRLFIEFSRLHFGQKKVCCCTEAVFEEICSPLTKLIPHTLQNLSLNVITEPQLSQTTFDISKITFYSGDIKFL